MTKLINRRALVTGAGAGIGRAIAIELAKESCEVAVLDVNEAAAGATCGMISELGGSAFPIGASVADAEEVALAFGELDRRWKSLNILINNAGVNANRPTLELTDEDWHHTRSVNLDGVFFCSREAGRRMVASGGGTIVNVGSIYSLVAAPHRLAYCATKAAVAMMTKSLAIEWAQFNIRVNAVAPGYSLTPRSKLWRRKSVSILGRSRSGRRKGEWRSQRRSQKRSYTFAAPDMSRAKCWRWTEVGRPTAICESGSM